MTRTALLILALLATPAAFAAEIVLREVSTPFGSIVRLGDVATIDTQDESERERLAQLPLMTAPAPGTQQYVRRQAIRELLEAIGERLEYHRFSGAESIEISGSQAPAEPFAVERTEPLTPRWRPKQPRTSAPEASVGFRGDRWTPEAPARLTNRQRQEILDELIGAANRAASAAGFAPTLRANSIQAMRVEDEILRGLTGAEATLVDPRTVRPGAESPVRFRSAHTTEVLPVRFGEVRQVVVASRSVRRGELLTSANTELRLEDELDNAAVPTDAFRGLAEVAGLEASRGLRVGEPLTPAECVGPVLVRRGEPVTVSSGVGRIRVRLRGVARADGREGDFVSVEIHDGDRINAQVTGPRELAVLSGRPTPQIAAAYREGIIR